jgi:xylulokinase
MGKAYIGADLGTTGIRAGVYDGGFRLLGTGSGTSTVRRGPGGSLTQDPDEMYFETAKAVKSAIRDAGIEKSDVVAVSFDGQMAGIMGIDAGWKATTPYDSWLDTRCAPQVERMRRAQREIVRKTGIIPSFNHGPKMLWWKDNERDAFRRTSGFILPAAYVAGRLGGLAGRDAFIDWTYLHFTGFSDNRRLKWDERLTATFGFPASKLPRIVSPLAVVGEASGAGARLFGLKPGTPIAAGCGDTAACFLGTGAVLPGIAVDVAGTASVFALATDRFLAEAAGTVYASRSVIDGLWYSMSYINGGGMCLEWFRKTFAPDTSFAKLNRLIGAVPPGSDGLIFVPHLEGRAYPNNPALRGHWKGFTWGHGLAHFYRSILEGIGYEYAIYKETIMKLNGGEIPVGVRAVGGGSKSGVWNQIKSDILGSRYSTINREDISTLGSALVAASSVGHVKSLKETVRRIVKEKTTFSPDRRNTRAYAGSVSRYKKLLSEADV